MSVSIQLALLKAKKGMGAGERLRYVKAGREDKSEPDVDSLSFAGRQCHTMRRLLGGDPSYVAMDAAGDPAVVRVCRSAC
jgi:hypothetical protein